MTHQLLTTRDAAEHDLLDLVLAVTLPRVPDKRQQREVTFGPAFTEAQRRILSALLDALITPLRWLADVRLERLSQMVQLARLAIAAEPASSVPPGAGARRMA